MLVNDSLFSTEPVEQSKTRDRVWFGGDLKGF